MNFETVLEPLSFKYNVRESTRAKHPQLRITPRHGLEVIIPKRLKHQFDVPGFVKQKRHWIEKHLPTQIASTETHALPDQLSLRSIEEDWSVRYIPSQRFDLIENPLRELTLLGNTSHMGGCRNQLIHWLKRKAESHLGTWLLELSREVALPFRDFQIRAQQTRWGSCSSDGDIMLNYQLLFLPRLLTRHILLHELAHTRHMHHGPRFWTLLKQLDENTKEHAHQAKRASTYVPAWVHMK